jgi:hypothetical protein
MLIEILTALAFILIFAFGFCIGRLDNYLTKIGKV